jgi:DNA-binding CsgD family transcriptional regulator
MIQAAIQEGLLELIYGRSMGGPWDPFLRQLRETTRSVLCAVMHTHTSRRGPHFNGDVADHAPELDMDRINRLYREKYWRLEPVFPVDMRDGSIANLSWESSTTTEFYKGFIRANGLGPSLYARFSSPDGQAWWLGIARKTDDHDFSDADRSLCLNLLPHLRRSLQLNSQLEKMRLENTVYADTLNQAGVAVLILDQGGHVISGHNAGTVLSARYRCFSLQADRLLFLHRPAQMKLKEFLRKLSQWDGSSSQPRDAFRVKCDDRHSLSISLTAACVQNDGITRRHAVVSIREPQRAVTSDSPVLSQLYGLTRRESEVALAIANGKSLREIAAASARSQRTVRNHLQGVFVKTQTNRQAELAKLILRSVD